MHPQLGTLDRQKFWMHLPRQEQPKSSCKTSAKTELSETFLYSTDPSMFDEIQAARLHPIEKKVKNRRYGGDCYLYGMLASGWIDLVIEASMKLFDVMADPRHSMFRW